MSVCYYPSEKGREGILGGAESMIQNVTEQGVPERTSSLVLLRHNRSEDWWKVSLRT